MRRYTFAVVLSALPFVMIPAQASIILDQSGTVNDLLHFQLNDDTVTLEFRNLIGPQTIGPTFSTPSIFDGIGPKAPWTYHGPITRYTVSLTTAVPLNLPRYDIIGATYYDYYAIYNGSWTHFGGNDNSGGGYQSGECEFYSVFACALATQVGNKSTFTFDAQDNAFWDGYEVHWDWFNWAEFYGDLPIDQLDSHYRLQIFASSVPEPATWAMMLIGFGGLGLALRRRSSASAAT